MTDAEIRCVIVPMTRVDSIIPNAAIAEVTSYTEPQPVSDTPDWMLGSLLWRGWQVPLVSFAMLIGTAAEEPRTNARVCIIKSLIDNPRMPYFALLAQGFPRLTTVVSGTLVEVPTENNPIAVAGRLIVENTEVVVPDLDRLGHLVAHAAFGALPVMRQPRPA